MWRRVGQHVLVDIEPANSAKGDARSDGVVEYYNELADHYDLDRFGNSYGAYVDAQERRILRDWLEPVRHGSILDFGCGTGRLLDFATHGLDASPAMVQIARLKHPQKPVYCSPGLELAQMGIKFDAIFSLHVFMHLPLADIEVMLAMCRRQLRPGGLFILDLPTALRRKLTGYKPSGWHGATTLSREQVRSLAGNGWRYRATRGVLFFPIHRLPSAVRPALRLMDDLLGMTFLKVLSSYTLYCLGTEA
jgi:SAM-dependent methyltransferase